MIETKIAKQILNKLEKEADDVIIISRSSNINQIKFSNNKVSTTQNWFNNSISVFAAKDKKVVVTSLHNFSPESGRDNNDEDLKYFFSS